MPLSDLAFEVDDRPIPGDVRRFLREAERRIEILTERGELKAAPPSLIADDSERR